MSAAASGTAHSMKFGSDDLQAAVPACLEALAKLVVRLERSVTLAAASEQKSVFLEALNLSCTSTCRSLLIAVRSHRLDGADFEVFLAVWGMLLACPFGSESEVVVVAEVVFSLVMRAAVLLRQR